MAGSILLPGGRAWDARSSDFYWAVETLATQVQDEDLTAQLQEIADENIGILDIADFSESQQRELSTHIRRLPGLARAKMPEFDGRDAVIGRLEALVELLPSSSVHDG